MTVILIAEDDGIRAVLRGVFDRAGFSVLTAADGRAALHVAWEHHPDVILTDLDMPHLDGLQLCQAIREDPALADTPVAILSGGLQSDDPRTAGADLCGVLLKPFTKQDLVAAVRRHRPPPAARGLYDACPDLNRPAVAHDLRRRACYCARRTARCPAGGAMMGAAGSIRR